MLSTENHGIQNQITKLVKTFINSVANIFESATQKERRLAAELQAAREEHDRDQIVFSRYASLKDALDRKRAEFKATSDQLDAACKFDPQTSAFRLSRGMTTIAALSRNIAESEALARHVESIKAKLRGIVLADAELNLKEFELTHADTLAKYPAVRRADEKFISTPDPGVHRLGPPSNPPSREVRIAVGLMPGQN